MTFAQQRNRLTTHFSERIPVVKQRVIIYVKINKILTTKPFITNLLLHGADSFLRSWQVLSESRNSPHFMEPEGSLPHSQVLSVWIFRNKVSFLRWGVVKTSPKPQTGGSTLVGFSPLFIQYIRSYPPYCRPFLHGQPEDAPCRGDRDPLIVENYTFNNIIMRSYHYYRICYQPDTEYLQLCTWTKPYCKRLT